MSVRGFTALPALFVVEYGLWEWLGYVYKARVCPSSGCAQSWGDVSGGASVERCVGKISGGSNIFRPVAALICGEDCPHFRVWGHMAQSEGIRVH